MTPAAFSVLAVDECEVESDEPGGAEEKVWLRSPDDGELWLFKPVTNTSHRHGEDWAEKATSHLAEALGVPCARVELATRTGREGSISRNLRPRDYEMQPGQVVLAAAGIPGYEAGNVPGRPGHSLAAISSALAGSLPPPGSWLPPGATAFDAFAGYVLLDAWVANQDRHDENWSLLRSFTPGAPDRLAGSYDHANSLGYNLQDRRRALLLERADGVTAWARNGKAIRFDHTTGPPVTLVELARQALWMATDVAREHWLERYAALDDDLERSVLDRIPVLSDPARTFALTVARANRERINRACR